MKKIFAATLLTLAAVPTSIFFISPAKAETYTSCYPVTYSQVSQDAADHPGAYRDGYREGRESARDGEAYRPRSAGGEFARGFEDGYFGSGFAGQQYRIPDRVQHFTSRECDTYRYRDRGNVRRQIRRQVRQQIRDDSRIRW